MSTIIGLVSTFRLPLHFTTPASNPPPQLHRILHSTCQSTAQKSSVRMKSGDYTTCFQTVAKTPALSKLGQLA